MAWAEYWNPQDNPNLLLEVDDQTFLQQVRALEFHHGEVSRNPYHLRLLGWYMDTVRRGSEWLSDKGAPSAPMLMGQLYRLEKWENGRAKKSGHGSWATGASDLTDWL